MDDVSVDNHNLRFKGRTAILDTGQFSRKELLSLLTVYDPGTTLIVAPLADANTVHKQIPGAKPDGQGGFIVPCNTQSSIALIFGGMSFSIEPQDIAVQPIDPNDLNGDCVSGIAAGDIGGATEWLVSCFFFLSIMIDFSVS